MDIWSNVVVIPCPKDAVDKGNLPQLNLIGFPTSSKSNSIFSITPSFFKYDLKFSTPNFCAILTDPMLPDLTNICSAVKFEGILLSYSLMGKPAQVIDFG